MASHLDYFVDKKTGGNAFTISFGHSMEYITKGKYTDLMTSFDRAALISMDDLPLIVYVKS